MNEFGWGTYTLLLIGFVALFGGKMKDWWWDKQIRKCLAFDRICRLADIGEKDLRYHVRNSYPVRLFLKGGDSAVSARHFSIQFIYLCPMIERGNPMVYAGEVQEFDTIRNCCPIEDAVAEAIKKIKAAYSTGDQANSSQ